MLMNTAANNVSDRRLFMKCYLVTLSNIKTLTYVFDGMTFILYMQSLVGESQLLR